MLNPKELLKTAMSSVIDSDNKLGNQWTVTVYLYGKNVLKVLK